MRSWEAFSPVQRVSKHWEYLQENVRVPVREGGSGGVKYGKYDVTTRDNSGHMGASWGRAIPSSGQSGPVHH